MLNIVWLLLTLAREFSKFLDRAQIEAAETRGEDVGLVKEFLLWTEALDARLEAARRARDDVESGRVPVSPTDPNDRSLRSPDNGTQGN